MAKVKKIVENSEIKTVEQLRAALITKSTDLLEARRGNAAGELTNPKIISVTRKEIARIHTAIRADEIAKNNPSTMLRIKEEIK